MARFSFEKTAEGPVAIIECSPNGTYVCLENKSKKVGILWRLWEEPMEISVRTINCKAWMFGESDKMMVRMMHWYTHIYIWAVQYLLYYLC